MISRYDVLACALILVLGGINIHFEFWPMPPLAAYALGALAGFVLAQIKMTRLWERWLVLRRPGRG